MMVWLTIMHGTMREQIELARNMPGVVGFSLPRKGLAPQASRPGRKVRKGRPEPQRVSRVFRWQVQLSAGLSCLLLLSARAATGTAYSDRRFEPILMLRATWFTVAPDGRVRLTASRLNSSL